MRIESTIPKGWGDYSNENPGMPFTYVRDLSKTPGALQLSFTLHRGGPEPNPSQRDLEQLTKDVGQTQGFGDVVDTHGGSCRFGTYGTAVFKSDELPRAQVWWHLSNGKDFILVTHICTAEADPAEVREAEQIATSARLARDARGWKLWK